MPRRAEPTPSIAETVMERPLLLEAITRGWPAADKAALAWLWGFWGRGEQLAPAGEWLTWLIMAGRGFGKTRAGAEWVRSLAEAQPRLRIALVGATRDEARAVMVEGESGLLAIAPPHQTPRWEPSKGLLTWPNGSKAYCYSAAEPDGLRGPVHHYAWADEIAKWPRGTAAWDNLAMGLRLGAWPRAVATTTPRPVALIRSLAARRGTIITGGRMADNRLNLPIAFQRAMRDDYAGTRAGRQELDGELIEDVEGALWTRALMERCRVHPSPSGEGAGVGLVNGSARWSRPHPDPSPEGEGLSLVRIVIGVDPPAGVGGDECGIVVTGRDGMGRAFVLEDASVTGLAPEGWARAVADAAARWGADRVIAEANNGGAMVESVLRAADAGLAVTLVHASRGKSARAEPVSALYARGKAFHAGAFPELEDQMCAMTAGGYEGAGRSPDRADALVWAMTELMLGRPRAEPRIVMF